MDDSDDQPIKKTRKFLHDGCSCALGPKGSSCSRQFSEEEVIDNLNHCLELEHDELDLVILGQIQAFTKCESGKRNRIARTSFYYHSRPICKDMFLSFYGLSYSRFRRLKEHYECHGVSTRTHGNKSRLPANTSPQSAVQAVHAFLANYVEENAISLPGRIPGFKNEDIKLLSSSETKIGVWRVYSETCEVSCMETVSYRTFLQLWDQFYPNVVVANPRTDLCLTCQQNTNQLQRACNLSDKEKSEILKAHQDHLNHAQTEREFYKDGCRKSEKVIETMGNDALFNCGSRSPCSLTGTVHYSFDYAQQVHIPSNPMQPGPIYFKTPRKCGIFGVVCEGIPRQVNFLIDEAVSVGKGANATTSYLHYFFACHGLKETNVHLHADNCAGQNKNNTFLWYLCWRTLVNLHHSVLYSFLVAGHTKFAPDGKFGIFKKAYEVTYVSSLYEFASLVDTCSTSGVNKAQLVGTHDGKVIVPVYDWVSFLGQYFRKLPNILKYHHFRFSKENRGMVYFREYETSLEQNFMLLKNNVTLPAPTSLPRVINPEGLTEERKTYLFREIRQFCKPGTEDLVASAP